MAIDAVGGDQKGDELSVRLPAGADVPGASVIKSEMRQLIRLTSLGIIGDIWALAPKTA